MADYDYANAMFTGPGWTGHGPSIDPYTGTVLKYRNHPTFSKTLAAEAALGNVVGPLRGRDISIPSTRNYLSGKNFGDIMNNQQMRSLIQALAKKKEKDLVNSLLRLKLMQVAKRAEQLAQRQQMQMQQQQVRRIGS